MESLFSPRIRYRDRLESQRGLEEPSGRGDPSYLIKKLQDLQELNLDVSTEELLGAERALTYADLHAMLGNEDIALWLTPHATIARGWHGTAALCSCWLRADYNVHGKAIHAYARSSGALLDIGDVVRRFLLADISGENELQLRFWQFDTRDPLTGRFFGGASLAYLMEHCRSLKTLKLEYMSLNEDQIRILGDFSRQGLEIELNSCRFTGAAAALLARVLGRNQGPTKLNHL